MADLPVEIQNEPKRFPWEVLQILVVTLVFGAGLYTVLSGRAAARLGLAEPPVVRPLPLGEVISDGTVTRRSNGSLDWKLVERKGKFFARDLIATSGSGRASLVFPNQGRLYLEPGTLIQIEEVWNQQVVVSVQQGHVEVAEGSVVVRPISQPLRQLAMIAPPSLPLSLPPTPLPPGVSKKTPDVVNALDATPSMSTALLRGLPEVEPLEQLQAPLSQRLKDVVQNGLAIEKAVPPTKRRSPDLNRLSYYRLTLVWPIGGTRQGNEWIQFAWTPTPVPGVKYFIEVCRDADFTRVSSYPVKNNHPLVQFKRSGNFYWRVRAQVKNDKLFSKPSQITVALNPSARPEMPDPKLDGPTNPTNPRAIASPPPRATPPPAPRLPPN